YLRPGSRRLPEGELGDGVADAALDPLRSERDLVVALALTPLLCAVGVADGHAHDRDRSVDAAERCDARNAAAGADDHLAADLLPKDAVRRADIAATLRCDGRRLEPEAVLADRGRCVMDNAVVRGASALEGEIETREVELDLRHLGREHAQTLFEEFLAGLVA